MKTINVWFIILSIEEGLHGIVSCTACGQQVNHFQKDSIYRHPTLKVLICKVCVNSSTVCTVCFCFKCYLAENKKANTAYKLIFLFSYIPVKLIVISL